LKDNKVSEKIENLKKVWDTPSILELPLNMTLGGNNGDTEQGLNDATNGPSNGY